MILKLHFLNAEKNEIDYLYYEKFIKSKIIFIYLCERVSITPILPIILYNINIISVYYCIIFKSPNSRSK